MRRVRRDEALLTSVTGDAGSGQILEILARDYGAEFLLVDYAGQVVAGRPPADTVVAGTEVATAVSGVDRHTGIEVGGRAATAFPVVAHGAIEAVLICFRGIDELTDDERSAFATTCLAAVVFPWRRKAVFDGAPKPVRMRLFDVPVIALCGAVAFVMLAVMIYTFLTNPIFGANTHTALEFFLRFWVIGFVMFWVARAIRINQGVPFDVAMAEFPPE